MTAAVRYRAPFPPAFGCLGELLPWSYGTSPTQSSAAELVRLRPPRKLYTPRSPRSMNRSLSGVEISALPSSPAADGVDSK